MKRYLLQSPADAAESKKGIALEETGRPSPGATDVLVRIEACSLNYRDLLMKSGQSASGGTEPVVPLSDGAGTVEEVGGGVTEWKEGDRVTPTFFRDWVGGRFDMRYHKAARGGSCDGVLSEYIVAPETSLVRVPAHLSQAEAATLPCAALTAWHALFERSRPLQEGESVLCLGTGGVSIFALQLAKAAGAKVIITSSADDKLERARSLGADETINYRQHPEWDKAVYEITGKRGADHVIEVGGPGTLERSMNSAAAGGSIALIGVLTGFDPPGASLFPLVSRNVDLSGIYVGSREMFERMNVFLEKHSLRPVIDEVFAFSEAAKAYDTLEAAGHFGKIAIEVGALQ